MANREDNLKPFTSEQSRELAAINGRKGGIASGEAKRRRKALRECLEELLEKEHADSKGNKATGVEAISIALFKKAASGDIQAFTTIRDTVGEKPTEKMDIGGGLPIIIKDDLAE